jgi:crossover junction endodeoxyribonuclease RusA
MTALTFDVLGVPAAQGSKRHVGRGILVESSKKVAPWREAVKAAAVEALGDTVPYEGPVVVTVSFRFARPAGHYGSGKNVGVLKPSAPPTPISRANGDIDKLVRSTLDALTDSQVFGDDSQVALLIASKQYADDAKPGATLRIKALGE